MKSSSFSTGRRSSIFTLILWCLVVLVLAWQFAPLLFGNRTMIPVDNLFQFAPYRAAAGEMGIVRPHIPLYSDLILQNYPWWKFIRQSLGSGQLPLWNPYLFSGTPFLAKGQHMVLYPFSILFYMAPLGRAYSLFFFFHLALAVFTAGLLARTVGTSRYGSLLSGIVYGLSGFMLARAVFPMMIAAAAWLPLVLAMAERIITRRRFRGRQAALPWILFGGIGLGMQGLIGHPEILIYTLLTLFIYCLCRLLVGWLGRSEGSAAPSPRQILPGLAIMVMTGLLIGAVQLLPQYLVLQENFRKQAAGLSQVLSWSYPWQHVVTMLVPNYFGNPARYTYTNLFNWHSVVMSSPIGWGRKNFVEGACYVGILPLLLALAGLCRRPPQETGIQPVQQRGPSPLVFLLLTMLSLCFVYGTPLYFLVYVLPGMEQVHSPFRWVMVSTLGIAILVGFGLDRLQQRPSLTRPFARFCAVGGGVILFCLLLVKVFFVQLAPMVAEILHHSGGNSSIFPDPKSFFSYEAPWFILLAILLIICGLVFKLMGHSIKTKRDGDVLSFWQPLAVLVIVIDLMLFVYHLYPAAEQSLLRYTPGILARMQKDRGLWRFTTFDPDGKKIFPANFGWLYNFQDIRGYDSTFSLYYRKYMETVDKQDQLLYNRIAPLRTSGALDSPLLDLLNVKYVMAQRPIDDPGYHLVDHGDGLLLYRNGRSLPRAFSLPLSSTVRAENPFAAMRRYDPRFYMILPTKGAGAGDLPHAEAARPTPGKPGPAEIVRYRNNEVVISVSAKGPIWLVLADSYDRGWQATAWPAGSPERVFHPPVRRAYGALRAVRLTKGDWVVRFRYRPLGFSLGLGLSLTASVFTAIGLLVAMRRSKGEVFG